MTSNIYDRRRVNGPARSVEPVYIDAFEPIAFPDGLRNDGRSLDQLRPIYIKTGPLAAQQTFSSTAPSGSAYYEQGKIRRSHIRGADEKETAQILEQAIAPAIRLEAYPKACIDAYVTVIESDGKFATISAAINCISAALADAGIELYDTVTSCSMSSDSSRWVADCSQSEEDASSCSLLVAYMPSADEITYLLQNGKSTLDQTEQAVQACTNSCTRVYAVISHYLQSSMKQPGT
ncbi:3'-5'-exoribonuclease [Coemansia sp. RSA 1939]|nr:3'-5'-exoribonuclease [Coemansia sp. RSA 1939]KAJ2610393.1 3'-5'-exoribonuclease [Coemansia sp. RSA 1804]